MSSSSTLGSTLAQPWVEAAIRLSTRLTGILALLLKTISATWSNSLGCGWVNEETVTNLTCITVRRIPPSFTSLPPEVIVEILKGLKCQDILRVQQVRTSTLFPCSFLLRQTDVPMPPRYFLIAIPMAPPCNWIFNSVTKSDSSRRTARMLFNTRATAVAFCSCQCWHWMEVNQPQNANTPTDI